MQILRLLAARRAVSPVSDNRNDEEAFFDLDFSSCSLGPSSSSSCSFSFSESDDECTVLNFIISLQRSRSASPLIGGCPAAAPLKFCASDPPPKVKAGRKRVGISSLRTLSFGARKDVPLYGRRGSSSARSLRLLMDSTSRTTEDEHAVVDAAQTSRRASSRSRDVVRRCLAKISRRIRTASSARGIRDLRKCRSASSGSAPTRGDDDLTIRDGIAGAIAHCKESLRRASTSECDSRLLRSRSE